MAENLHHAGLKVQLVEMMNQIMGPLDFEMAEILHENLYMNNIDLFLGDGVKSFTSENGVTTINLHSGREIETDLVILSIGVSPNGQLAKAAGLEMNERGGVIVNSQLLTSDPNIYAVGDVIEVENYVTKSPCMVPLAGPANKQARICANNILGAKEEYKGTQGTAIAQVFDLVAASVGLNEKQLIAIGMKKDQDYHLALINQKSHASYYPGATSMNLKMLFDKNGMIFGAQIVGQDGVDKRIDVLATTMRMNGTIYDLKELELAYAPPFGSAKDPVNMLGFVAENILTGIIKFVDSKELDEMIGDENVIILDVGEEEERIAYAIPQSVHIPLGELRDRHHELDPNKKIIAYCAIGVRSYNGVRILKGLGFKDVSALYCGSSLYKTLHFKELNLRSAQPPVKPSSGIVGLDSFNLEGEDKESHTQISREEIDAMVELDLSGLQCPGPIMRVNSQIKDMKDGQILKVSATDMGFSRDVSSWCRRTGNTFICAERTGKLNTIFIKKGLEDGKTTRSLTETGDLLPPLADGKQNKTIIVFSGDLDKVLASFIIANGAASMGRKVTMFFTFWGLNALRKSSKQDVKKPFIEKMFGAMMPRGASALTLSNMNMGGVGTKMMKMVMKDKNVNSLEELMQQAMDNGVSLMACTMSMDIMGINKEELIDGVEFGGVASYLGDAEEANVNLFI